MRRAGPMAAMALCAVLLIGADEGSSAGPSALSDFQSDGCSSFPDGDYYSCCYLHDVAYWPGGTEEERQSADRALRVCVRDISGGFLARLMHWGVRIWGGPGHDRSYRWGFGWPYPYRRDYSPLTAEQRQQVADKTRVLCESLRPDPGTGGYVVGGGHEISAVQARTICPDLPSASRP